MGDNATKSWDWHNTTVGEGYQARGVVRQRTGGSDNNMKIIDMTKQNDSVGTSSKRKRSNESIDANMNHSDAGDKAKKSKKESKKKSKKESKKKDSKKESKKSAKKESKRKSKKDKKKHSSKHKSSPNTTKSPTEDEISSAGESDCKEDVKYNPLLQMLFARLEN